MPAPCVWGNAKLVYNGDKTKWTKHEHAQGLLTLTTCLHSPDMATKTMWLDLHQTFLLTKYLPNLPVCLQVFQLFPSEKKTTTGFQGLCLWLLPRYHMHFFNHLTTTFPWWHLLQDLWLAPQETHTRRAIHLMTSWNHVKIWKICPHGTTLISG